MSSMKTILNSDLAYVLGNFMADGSFYKSDKNYRFEFVDGTPYKEELKYSFYHISKIKNILEIFLNRKLPNIRKKGNLFNLKFRDENLARFFIEELKIYPGKKYLTVDILPQYKNTLLEVYFWKGFLDGDGSISRKYRRIAVESMSKSIIDSFAQFLIKNNIYFSKYSSKRENGFSYVVLIKTVSFRDFANKIGFDHPLKSKLMKEKLKEKDFWVTNYFNLELFKGRKVNYPLIFNDTVFIEDGIKIARYYGWRKFNQGKNFRLSALLNIMLKNNLTSTEILTILSKYRFKKSIGSTNSVSLPFLVTDDLIRISKFVRVRSGGITYSKKYIESLGYNFEDILKTSKEIFGIKPKWTCKKEPLFCSGVISDFFNYLKTSSLNKENIFI